MLSRFLLQYGAFIGFINSVFAIAITTKTAVVGKAYSLTDDTDRPLRNLLPFVRPFIR